jgi:DNA-binding NtrC family response regulator
VLAERGKVARILVVAADTARRMRIEEALRAAGHAVEAFADVAAIDPDAYDAGVIEVEASSETRMDPVQELRARWPRLPLVPLVARPTIRTASRAFRAGALDVLIATDSPEGLRAAVAAALARRPPRRPTEA